MVFSTLLIVLLLALGAEAQTTCLTPAALGNGSVSYTTLTIDSVADYTCDLGYKLMGAPSVTCLCQNECSWSDAPPTCNIVDCGFPVATSNSAITCTRSTYLGTCTASCDTGYFTVGNCMVLTTNVNSVVVYHPDTKYQGVAVFSCGAGYSLLPGTGNRTCPANGAWSDTTPYCWNDVCAPPTPPNAGTVTCNSLLARGICTCFCDIGYSLSGNAVLTCLTDGTFDLLPPVCYVVASLLCSVQWTSPVIDDWQIVQTPLASFSPIDMAISAQSYLHCIVACNAHARVNCGGGNECSFAMYDGAAELCYTFYEDVANGTSVGCNAVSRCFRR